MPGAVDDANTEREDESRTTGLDGLFTKRNATEGAS
jgi:hypothetical protein